jgi:hypothetical protein
MRHTLKGDKDRNVWLDGKLLSPAPSQSIINHSPDGFNWGYGGSGPAQLAASIMLELTGDIGGYQDFKWDVVAKIPQGPFATTFEFPVQHISKSK